MLVIWSLIQVYIGMEIEYIKRETGKQWIDETYQISAMLSGLIKTKKRFITTKSLSFILLPLSLVLFLIIGGNNDNRKYPNKR